MLFQFFVIVCVLNCKWSNEVNASYLINVCKIKLKKNVIIQGLTFYKELSKNRTSRTSRNERSSRSHAIFRLEMNRTVRMEKIQDTCSGGYIFGFLLITSMQTRCISLCIFLWLKQTRMSVWYTYILIHKILQKS